LAVACLAFGCGFVIGDTWEGIGDDATEQFLAHRELWELHRIDRELYLRLEANRIAKRFSN